MSYFEHTKRDLAKAKREIGEAILALTDDTNRKLNADELDRTYVLEDLLARLVGLAHETGADVRLFEVGNVYYRHVPAYPIDPGPVVAEAMQKPQAGDVTQEIPRGVAKPLVSQATIREAAMLQTWDGGYPRHGYIESVFADSCGEMLRPVYGAQEMSARVCGRPRTHEIHNLNPEA